MQVYVASSWKNPDYQKLVDKLREVGFIVYDWRTSPTRFKWDEVFPPGEKYTAASYRKALGHPKSRAGYQGDMNGVLACDLCILCLPAGRSASWEYGFAMARGKGSIVYFPDGQEPDLMFLESFAITSTIEETVEAAIEYVQRVKQKKGG